MAILKMNIVISFIEMPRETLYFYTCYSFPSLLFLVHGVESAREKYSNQACHTGGEESDSVGVGGGGKATFCESFVSQQLDSLLPWQQTT